MFPVDSSFVYAAYLECAIIALVIGVVSGILALMILKLRLRWTAIAIDALLAASGSVIAVDGLWRLGFQHPFIGAVISAIVLPTLHQLFRFRRVRESEKKL